jgi:NADPH2:quinone reductase
MKAVVMTALGGPEVLEVREVPEPVIRASTDVKVRLRAAGVNPVDTKLRSRGLYFPEGLPAILGCDGAGVVEETGAGVTRFKPGDEVWFCDGGLGRAQGCYAEYKVVDEHIARRKPRTLSFVEAAAGPLVLITAWEALNDRARMEAGDRVLIHGAAGGVGHVAIQLAAIEGARVLTTVGSAEKGEFVRNLGAEAYINYREHDFVAAALAWSDGRGVDIALDTVGGEVFRRSMEAVADYGDLITLLEPAGGISWKEARNRNLRVGFVLMLTPMVRDLPAARMHQHDILDRCAEHIDSGEIKLHVGEVLPLEDAAEAHRLLSGEHAPGKIVLEIPE